MARLQLSQKGEFYPGTQMQDGVVDVSQKSDVDITHKLGSFRCILMVRACQTDASNHR